MGGASSGSRGNLVKVTNRVINRKRRLIHRQCDFYAIFTQSLRNPYGQMRPAELLLLKGLAGSAQYCAKRLNYVGRQIDACL